MNQNNLVSVIITTFNAEKYIYKTVLSVINQTYKYWELIIIDDCSKDSTWKMLESLRSNYENIHIFQNKVNYGCTISRNIGISKSKGRFISLLDHDDYWLPKKMELQVNFHVTHNCSASNTYYRRYDKFGNIGKLVKSPSYNTYSNLLSQNNIGYSSVMIDQLLIKNFKMIDLPLSDFPTWLYLLKKGHNFYTLENDLMRYFFDNSTDSANKIKLAIQRWRVIRRYEKLNYINTLFYMFLYLIKSIIKYKSL